jgi:hypothetical protein
MTTARIQQAIELMARFEARTREQRRYLWTDAFAVTNYLGLALATRETQFIESARGLINRVHQTLGQHRPDGSRQGWISGFPDVEGRAHPTTGGLRIGKPLDERPPDAEADDRMEWDRDGQYFHYLTKWMHALDQTSRVTGDLSYNCWARELAATAHRAFVYALPDGSKRMYWKMSIDLSRPVVSSMGQHDPLDGFVTYVQLQATQNDACFAPPLDAAIADFDSMIDRDRLATDDPLGIGGLLVDAYRLVQLDREPELLKTMLVAALVGLVHARFDVNQPAYARLAFRELGLAIGLAAVDLLLREADLGLRPELQELRKFVPLRDALEAFWLQPENQATQTWQHHADINEVMLATSLVPDGFLTLRRTGTARFNSQPSRQASHSG